MNNKVFNLTDKKKLLITFSAPRKSTCYSCLEKDRHEKRKKEYPGRSVEYSLFRNFMYEFKYLEKKEYKDQVVPVVYNSWQFIVGGFIEFCDICPDDDSIISYYKFWKFNGVGYNYLDAYREKYIIRSLPSIYRSIKYFIQDLPNDKGREVKRDWVDNGT